jgi:hypothetical protein
MAGPRVGGWDFYELAIDNFKDVQVSLPTKLKFSLWLGRMDAGAGRGRARRSLVARVLLRRDTSDGDAVPFSFQHARFA